MAKYSEEDLIALLKSMEKNMSVNKNTSSSDILVVLQNVIVELSASKVYGIQFKTILDNFIQKFNLEIGLNGLQLDKDSQQNWDEINRIFFGGLGSWSKAATTVRIFGANF